MFVSHQRTNSSSHHPGGGDASRGQHYAPDYDQFLRGQRKLWIYSSQYDIHYENENGENKERSYGKMTAGKKDISNDEIVVGGYQAFSNSAAEAD